MSTKWPPFKDEAEAARWYAEHPEYFAEKFDQAKKDGRLRRLSELKVPLSSNTELMHKGAGRSPTITIRLPHEDIDRAKRLAGHKGLKYQTYIKMLLHEALRREEADAG